MHLRLLMCVWLIDEQQITYGHWDVLCESYAKCRGVVYFPLNAFEKCTVVEMPKGYALLGLSP